MRLVAQGKPPEAAARQRARWGFVKRHICGTVGTRPAREEMEGRMSRMCPGCPPSLANYPASLLAPANAPPLAHVLGPSSLKYKHLHLRSVSAASSSPDCPSFSTFPRPVHLFYRPRPRSCSPRRSVFTSDYSDRTIILKTGGGGGDILHFFGIVTVSWNGRQRAAS